MFLVSELQATLRLIGRRRRCDIARHRGLKVVGTLAALDVAAAHGRVELQTVVERLLVRSCHRFTSWRAS